VPAPAKTKVVMTPEFIRDLQISKHPNLARQALSHVFAEDGTFKTDRDDHQYDGITDGWIRWVQMSGAGLRVIYIRKRDTVYLYRVVGKSDEGRLSDPKTLDAKAVVEGLPEEILKQIGESTAVISERLLKNTEPMYLREAFRSMYHVLHTEIVLISPQLSFPLFRFDGEIGRFLDRAIEEGARSILVTLPPNEGDIPFFDDLARRNIEVYFTQNLRSRLFLFNVAEYRTSAVAGRVKPTAILGSAELTHHSLDMGGVGRHEELCYRFPDTHFGPFYSYAHGLVKAGIDLQGHKIKLKAG
jgi:hypothetical protein